VTITSKPVRGSCLPPAAEPVAEFDPVLPAAVAVLPDGALAGAVDGELPVFPVLPLPVEPLPVVPLPVEPPPV
jgi:hypothetical protein